MSNQKKWMRVASRCVLFTLALAMVVSAGFLFIKDSVDTITSHIKLTDGTINTNRDQFLNSAVMYKLPDAVKDTDDISVIVQMKTESLLDAYEQTDKKQSFGEYYYSDAAKTVADGILAEKENILQSFAEKNFAYTLGADYKAIFGGFEVVIKAGDFETLCKTLGDRGTAIVGEEYNPSETKLVENKVNVYETGIFNSASFGYDGSGTVVAVLDTGLDYNHTAFSPSNFTASKLGMTFADVEAFIADTKASKLHSGLTASDVYLNNKVPFAFDYADSDPDVYPMTPGSNSHGTHVAGVIAGKDDVITGVAPNAQLAIMKIFSDVQSTARSSWILSALEDCVVLGVDVINMSIGTSCGFSRESDREAMSGVYDRVRATGISMVVAASNSYNSTYGSEKNGNLGLTSNPDSATVGSPSTYEGAMSVASISGKKTPYLLYNGTIIYFIESYDRVSEEKSFYDDVLLSGVTEMEIDYVTIPGAGRSADYNGIDVAGKVALVRRGSTTFEEKANIAQQKGAAGIIVYNNVSGDIKMNVGDATLGVCSISQDDGEMLAAAGSGKLKLSRSQTSGPFMSDFSSWGPTPDLGIKPEITAHGGEIYSAVPGQAYDRQSGTSMACPNLAGMTALLRQYVVENFPAIRNDGVKVAAFVNQLMMSTADIVYNTNGLPYAVRKQGAGLANLDNVAKTKAYIITYKNGQEMNKTKLELGDDPTKSGVYTLHFAVKNFGTTALSYDVSAIVMTEGVSATKTNQGETTVDEQGYILGGASVAITSISGATNNGMNVTVGAGATADITLTITLSDADKKYLDDSFENGMYVEGFVVLDAADENVVDLNVPYLAFYGDWTKAPLFDLDYFATNKDELDDSIDLLDKTLPDAYATRPIGTTTDDFVSYLGSFYFLQDPSTTPIAADRKYISLSNQDGTVHELSYVWAGMLRNAAKIVITITDDATGEVVFERVEEDVRKSYGDGGTIHPANVDIGFDTYEENLKNNSTYTVRLQGYLDYGDGGLTTNENNVFEFPLTADFQAPAVTDCEFYTEYDRSQKKTRLFAKIAVYDNHYAMAMQVGYVGNSSQGYMLETFDQYLTPIYSEKNSTSYVIYELTDYVDDIKRNAVNTNSFVVATYDYALNIATYEIQLPDDFDAFYFEEESVTLSPNQTYTLAPVAYPGVAWTELLDYVSTNTKVVRVVNNKLVAVAPGEAVIVAKDPASGEQSLLNVKVLAEGEKGFVRYDKPVTDSFTLTGYYTNKAYYQLASADRDIGTTGDEMKFTGNYYSLSMYPSEQVTLHYKLIAYFPDDVEVVAESSSEDIVKVEKVNGEWVVTAHAEGYASVTLSVMMDGKSTYYSQSINVDVKNPYITTGPSLTHYFGLGGLVEIPKTLAITDIGQFAFSNFEYVAKGPDDEISEDDPALTKQWFMGDDTITTVVIPEGVKTINAYAFANLTALTKVVLPSTIEFIDFYAFYGCTALEQVQGIEHAKFINRSSFENCALKGTLNLSGTVAIADRAFAGNTMLSDVILGEGIQSVGAYAFSGNVSLKSVTINAEIIKLGQYAFNQCTELEEIEINAAVIPTGAFNECTSLEKITLGKDVAVIGEYAFSNAPATTFELHGENAVFASVNNGAYLTNKAGTELLLVAPGVKGIFRVDDSKITSIGNAAFAGHLGITSVVIPSVTRIGNYAFAYCEKLSSVTLGELEQMGTYAFYRSAITSVPSLAKLDRISDYAFAHTKVTSLVVRDGMTVGKGAFSESRSLASVTIGNNVVIEADAFRLDRETNFSPIPGTYRDPNTGKLIYYFVYVSPLHSLTIGDNVQIGSAAFMGAAELVSVTLGDGAIIGDSAFYNAVNLKNIDLSGVKSIGAKAFSGDVLYEFDGQNLASPAVGADKTYLYRYYAPALTAIDLSSVTYIGEEAFAYCTALESVVLGEQIEKIPSKAFNYCENLAVINLDGIKHIGDNAFGEAGLTEVNLPAIEKIDDFAFIYNDKLTKVTFGSNAVTLGEGAFAYCDLLAEVVGADKITVVGDYAFAYTVITSIDLTGAVSIGDSAFIKYERTPFTVTLGEKLTALGENPFAMCQLAAFSGIKIEEFNGQTFAKPTNTYDISESVKVIDGMLYRVVPNGLELISYAGESTVVTVAEGTVRITAHAFAGADVVQVVLPSTLYSIGHKAFFGCEKLTVVCFASYEAPILEEEFDYSYWVSGDGLPATGTYQYQDIYTGDLYDKDGLSIVPYFMWNAAESSCVVYYGANFIDYIGHMDNTILMVMPSNGQHYDSFVYGQYFSASAPGAAAADATTLAAIATINALPEKITLAHKDLVLAARAAYDKVATFTQRALVTNLDKLLAAEQKISDLEYIRGEQGSTQTPPVDENNEPTDVLKKPIDGKTVAIVILSILAGLALAATGVLCFLYIKSKQGDVAEQSEGAAPITETTEEAQASEEAANTEESSDTDGDKT